MRQPPEGNRADHALPLAEERSRDEQLIELHVVLEQLADDLGVDCDVPARAGVAARKYSASFGDLGDQLRKHPTNELWDHLADLAYLWDAHIQDTLAISSAPAAAYQLGRGLAETYWALDPTVDDPNDWRSWGFLLGERRCGMFGRLAARLVSHLDPLSVPAITTSLDAWNAVTRDDVLRKKPETLAALYDQGLLWRDLVRGERRPEDLVVRQKGFMRLGILVPVWRAFWLQIVVSLIGAGLLAFSGAELAAGRSAKTYTFVAVLSALGVTSTAAYTRAKGIATSLLARLRAEYERDRIGLAANLAPKVASGIHVPGRAGTQNQIDSSSPRITRPSTQTFTSPQNDVSSPPS